MHRPRQAAAETQGAGERKQSRDARSLLPRRIASICRRAWNIDDLHNERLQRSPAHRGRAGGKGGDKKDKANEGGRPAMLDDARRLTNREKEKAEEILHRKNISFSFSSSFFRFMSFAETFF